jgi:hypothetical protein
MVGVEVWDRLLEVYRNSRSSPRMCGSLDYEVPTTTHEHHDVTLLQGKFPSTRDRIAAFRNKVFFPR